MKGAFLFMLVCLMMVCQCLAAQQAGVEGVAIDAVTRQPMAGVHIVLEAPGSDDVYGAVSRRDGHFSVAGMKPAPYFLRAQRNGYVYVPGKNAGVTLKPGEQVTDLKVEMTPHAVIAGRVLDEYGDPVHHAEVQALPAIPGRQASDQTDERGQFRVAVPPGKFYVRATPRGMVDPHEIRSDGPGPPVYGTTYYPGTESKAQATAVELAAGREATGIDIRLTRKHALTISGMVRGIPDHSKFATSLTVSDAKQTTGVREFDADGRFTVSFLTAGHYRLLAKYQSPNAVLQSQFVDVQLENTNVSGMSLTLVQGETLSGTLEMQGGSAEKVTVRLEPYSLPDRNEAGPVKGAEVDRDGSFRLEQVFPQKLRVRVTPLPENAFIKSVKVDNADAPDGVLDFSRGVTGSRIKVVVGRNGGQVEGAVLDEDGKPLGIPLGLVVLAATVDEISWENLRRVEAGAKFKYTGLRPGKYRLMAIDARQFTGEFESIKALFPKAPEIEIREGDRIAKDVRVMAAETTSAKP